MGDVHFLSALSDVTVNLVLRHSAPSPAPGRFCDTRRLKVSEARLAGTVRPLFGEQHPPQDPF